MATSVFTFLVVQSAACSLLSATLLTVPRYKLTIAYDGTDFCGWQKQEPLLEHAQNTGSMKHVEETLSANTPDRVALRTVQAVVEKAIREVVREEVILFGASRTDSGVHARGQIGAFTTTEDPERIAKGSGWPIERGLDSLLRAINGRLPRDVLITAAELVDQTFDPVGDCTSKAYSYTIHASRTRALWDRSYVHHVWEPLELGAMEQAAAMVVGEHDFAAFAAAGHGRVSTVRTIHSCTIRDITAQTYQDRFGVDTPVLGPLSPTLAYPTESRRYRIDISGNGFLWNMVRIIAGTIADAGRGRRSLDDIARALSTGDRKRAGPTFPPMGLCLEWVRYR